MFQERNEVEFLTDFEEVGLRTLYLMVCEWHFSHSRIGEGECIMERSCNELLMLAFCG